MGHENGFDARSTYGAGAAVYEKAARRYWSFSAERSVERVSLEPGERVLDVACGTGTSAIPAAHAVGHRGSVLAIDYAEPMLNIAREKAEDLELDNIEFRLADIDEVDLPEEHFDAVIFVLGIFFIEDMPGVAQRLWRTVRPGGRLAITVLGPDAFEPLIGQWRHAVSELRPSLDLTLPWQRTDDPDVLAKVMRTAGIEVLEVDLEENRLLFHEDDVWDLVMGTGLRSITSSLGEDAEIVRSHLEDWMARERPDSVDVAVIYAQADKPAQ